MNKVLSDRKFYVYDQEELLSICDELNNWNVQHELVLNTPLTYPDIKYTWRILMDAAGGKSFVRPKSSRTLPELIFILQQVSVQSVFYRCAGLTFHDLDKIVNILSRYSAGECSEKWYAITHLLDRSSSSQLLDALLPFKSNIRFGWRVERIMCNNLSGNSIEAEPSGYTAVSLWLAVSADNGADSASLCENIEHILSNDLCEGDICLGSSLTECARNKILDGYDPMLVIEPLVISDEQWKNCLFPSLQKFDKYFLN